jgi:acetolactate synthase regulatory subunit
MISAKRAREIANPKFERNTEEVVSRVLKQINERILEQAEAGFFRLRFNAWKNLNSYEEKKVISILRNRGFRVKQLTGYLHIGWLPEKL